IVQPRRVTEGSSKTAEVRHSFSFLPKEWVHGWNTRRWIGCEAGEGLARNLSAIVNNPGIAVRAAQGTEVLHPLVAGPPKGMRLGCRRGEEESLCEGAAERTKIVARESGVREWIESCVQRRPDYLPAVVVRVGTALISTQCSQVGDFTALPDDRIGLRPPGK